jgi:GNAT superfamily N-acetyltransferase
MIRTLLCEVPVLPQPATRLPSCVIKQVTADELSGDPKFAGLIEEYADESAIAGMPRPNYQLGMYKHMEMLGHFHMIGAYVSGELVGFLTMVDTVLPHYGKRVATVESYFLTQAHRRGGPGLDLLRAAEWLAKELGAVGILVSAPHGGKLARVMPRAKYKHTNEVFFKGLA